MKFFYFPESVYIEAHMDYLKKTGKNPYAVREYCKNNLEFFVEVAFSYIDGTSYPEMKEVA